MKGLIALNVQVAMALIEVNEDKELITKRVAESWIWPRQVLPNGHVTSATRPCFIMARHDHSHNWATAQLIQRPSLLYQL